MRQIEDAQFQIYLPQRIPVTKHFTSYSFLAKTCVKFELLIYYSYYTSQLTTTSSGKKKELGGIRPESCNL